MKSIVPRASQFWLQGDPASGLAGDVYEVDVYGDFFSPLRGYEVGIDVSGGDGGALKLEDVYVNKERPAFVFSGRSDAYPGVDVAGGRLSCILVGDDVGAASNAYLGTFVFRASQDATGTFTVSCKTGDGVMVGDPRGDRFEVDVIGSAEITITPNGGP